MKRDKIAFAFLPLAASFPRSGVGPPGTPVNGVGDTKDIFSDRCRLRYE